MKFVYKALLYLFNWIWKDFRRPKQDTHDFFEEEWDDYLELDRSQQAEWSANSPCVCPSCSFQGVVSQFRASNQKESCHG